MKPRLPKPVKSDYYTDTMSYHDDKSRYMDFIRNMNDTDFKESYLDSYYMSSPTIHGLIRKFRDSRFIGTNIYSSEIKEHFNEMEQLFKAQLKLLQHAFQEHISDLYSPRNEIIKRIEIVNQITGDWFRW